MPNVRFVDGLKYGFKLFGFLLGLFVVSGMLIGGGVFAFSSANLVRIMNGAAATSQYALVVGGGLAAILGVVLLHAALIGAAYKLVADGVTEGMDNAGTGSRWDVSEPESEAAGDDPIGTDEDVGGRADEAAAPGATAAGAGTAGAESAEPEGYGEPTVGADGSTADDRQTVPGTASDRRPGVDESGTEPRAAGQDSGRSGEPQPGHQRDIEQPENRPADDEWPDRQGERARRGNEPGGEYGQPPADDATPEGDYGERAGREDTRAGEEDEWSPREATADYEPTGSGDDHGETGQSDREVSHQAPTETGDYGGQDDWEPGETQGGGRDEWEESTDRPHDANTEDEWKPTDDVDSEDEWEDTTAGGTTERRDDLESEGARESDLSDGGPDEQSADPVQHDWDQAEESRESGGDDWTPPEASDEEVGETQPGATAGEDVEDDGADLWAVDEAEGPDESSGAGTEPTETETGEYYTDSRPGEPTEEAIDEPGSNGAVDETGTDETPDEESSTTANDDSTDEEFGPVEEPEDFEDTSDEPGDWEPLDEDDL